MHRANQKAMKFAQPVHGLMKHGTGPLRFSSLVNKLLTLGADVTAFVRDKEIAGSSCPIHGDVEDPIVLLMPTGDRVGFCCPDCCAPEVKAAWEREGAENERGRN